MPVNIDIVILSYGKTEKLKSITQDCINSLIISEDPTKIKFNVLVIESEKSLSPYQYPNSTTIYPDVSFGFNKYMNIGIKATTNNYVCLCNNDLIFHKYWASEILKAMGNNPKILSANPMCQYFSPHLPYNNKTILGNKSNLLKGILTGWCIFVKRDIFNIIGLFDEQFDFWYADNDYGRTLLKHNVTHALVGTSKVDHLGNQTHNVLSPEKLLELTDHQKDIYEKKWGKENISLWRKIKNILNRVTAVFLQ
jgi:GT2 family glycosyltransferase